VLKKAVIFFCKTTLLVCMRKRLFRFRFSLSAAESENLKKIHTL